MMDDTNQLIDEAIKDNVVTYDNKLLNYECQLCKKSMTGDIPLVQHLKNKKHIEAGVKYAINCLREAPPSLLRLLPYEVKSAAEEGVIKIEETSGGILGFCCTVCDKSLTGLPQVDQHLMGADHKKKLKTATAIGTLSKHNGSNPAMSIINSTPSCAGSRVGPTGKDVSVAWGIPKIESTVDGGHSNYNNGLSNGLSLGQASCPQISTEINNCNARKSWREPVKLPFPGNPVEGASNSRGAQTFYSFTTPPINNVLRRTEETEVKPIEIPREALPVIDQRVNNYMSTDFSNSLVQQAVNDQVLTYDNETMKYKCEVCQIQLNPQQAEPHLRHKTHKDESAKRIILLRGRGPPSLLDLLPSSAIEAAKAGTVIVTEVDGFQCLTCQKFANGISPLAQHLEGSEHQKKTVIPSHLPPVLRRATDLLYPEVSESPSSPLRLPGNHLRSQSSEDDAIDLLAEAFDKGVAVCTDHFGDQMKCNVCEIFLNGHKNLEQHLRGNKHLKQLQRIRRSEPLSTPSPTPASGTSTTETIQNIQSPDTSPKWTYEVTSEPRGHVHIFNYMFTGRKENPKERKGAEHDTENIMNTFSTMGYEVYGHVDETAEETENSLEQIRQNEELAKVDVLVLFFLSHGNEPHKFYANDGNIVDLYKIWNTFTDTACPFMKRKPKIIFTNFCRGGNDEMPESDAIVDVPRDMVTIHAASEGITALRNPKRGTHFIRSLCKILDRCAKDYNLREIYFQLDEVCKKELDGPQPKWEDSRFYKFKFNPLF